MEKERRTKALLLSTLVVVVATLSIAFAAMSRTLSINGIGKMDTASWSVYFDNLSSAKITRGAQEVGKPSISADKGTVQDINVKLSNPKDEISYTVDIVNAGTIDAEITMIKDIELTDVQKKVFEFKVTYTDTGEVLKDGDILPKDTTKNITINIKFKDDITEFDLPTEQQTINLSYQITYTQYDGSEIVIEPDGGDINTGKAVLAGNNMEEFMGSEDPSIYPFFNCTSITRSQVESIDFLNSNAVPTEYESTSWDASEYKDNSIIGWYQDTDLNGLYEVYIGSEGRIYAPSDSSGMFAVFASLKEINFNNFNTSDVTNMSWMFAMCMSLSNLDINIFNTSKVTNMSAMFASCSSLANLDLSNFNTSKVTNMSAMFAMGDLDNILVNINLSSFNTSNVTDMSMMFGGCLSLTNLDLSNFNTSKVTNMSNMFYDCESLTSLDLSSFDTSSVITMESMFEECVGLTFINLNSFNTGNVTNMTNMFRSCSSLINLNVSSFDTSNVTDMYMMFARTSLITLNLSNFIINETSLSHIFYECPSLTSVDLRNADFSNVTNYSSMFYNINSSIQIIVKDETQRTWMTTNFPELTNVVLPSEL